MDKKTAFPELEEVLKKTSEAIEEGKERIYEIAENSRMETERIFLRLKELQKKIIEIIKELDEIEKLERKARIELMEVSKNIHIYSGEDIKHSYEKASNLQAKVKLLDEKENHLRQERTELEYQLRRNRETIIKADELATKLTIAVDLLQDNLSTLSDRFTENKLRGDLGLKIISAQEEERKRLAREIHDGPAQLIANLVIRAELCDHLLKTDIAKAKEEMSSLKDQLRGSLHSVRNIIYDLRPMMIDDLGLIPALSGYIDHFIEQTGIEVGYDYEGIEYATSFGKAHEIAVYRVVQEALQNSYRHSECTEINVGLIYSPAILELSLQDNGKGFNYEDVIKYEGQENFGILGMKERIDVLGGEFALESSSEGTTIKVRIVLNDDKKAGDSDEENKDHDS